MSKLEKQPDGSYEAMIQLSDYPEGFKEAMQSDWLAGRLEGKVLFAEFQHPRRNSVTLAAHLGRLMSISEPRVCAHIDSLTPNHAVADEVTAYTVKLRAMGPMARELNELYDKLPLHLGPRMLYKACMVKEIVTFDVIYG